MVKLEREGGSVSDYRWGIVNYDKGYKLNQHKKENDLYWLLNLACLKLTGNFLPESCSTANTWSKFVNGNERVYAVPSLRPTHSIMSWDTSNGLDKQIKRSMICGEIKAIRNNYWWYRDQLEILYTKLGMKNIRSFITTPAYSILSEGDTPIDWEDSGKHERRRSNQEVKDILRKIAYKVLTGVDEDEFLRCAPSWSEMVLPTYKELAEFVKQSAKPNVDKPDLCYLFQDIWYSNDHKKIKTDRLISKAIRINKNEDSKNCCITRQNKIRKGMEQEFMSKYITALPYYNRGRVDNIRLMTNQDCLARYSNISVEEFLPKQVWHRYKLDSERISMDEYIGAMKGVPKNRFELIEKKLIKNFC